MQQRRASILEPMGIFNEIARVEFDGHLIEVETELRLTCEYRLLVDKAQLDSATAFLGTRRLRGELPDGRVPFVVHVKQSLHRTRYVLELEGREIPMAVCPFPASERRRPETRHRRRVD